MNHATRYRSSVPETTIFGVLTLGVLSALLMAVRPAQAQTATVLYNFGTGGDCTDGCSPSTSLTSDGAGNLYGTANGNGFTGHGTVFELLPNGSGGWNYTVLYNFTGGADGGGNPSNVIFDSLGNLYGTTTGGGAYGQGVVFELSPAGPTWTETVLYSFANAGDGAVPNLGGLIFDPAGNLYGTAEDGGGGYGPGVVFDLSPSGGGWTEQVIYVDGFVSGTGLTMDAAGNIFGTSNDTVFELSPNGSGGWNSKVIHNFSNIYLESTPVLDKAGNLYGTASEGGVGKGGLVYKLSPQKTGKWTEKTLYTFPCGLINRYGLCSYPKGSDPTGGIILDAVGNIYGAAASGPYQNDSNGTVYELVAPVGTGSYKEKVLCSFNQADGASPLDGLIQDGAGNLYGTTLNGGSNGNGVVFEANPSGVRATTTTTLTSSQNPSGDGQYVTFTAVVATDAVNGGLPPNGFVTFRVGDRVVATGSLSGGSASYTTYFYTGKYSVRAVYGGNCNLVGSPSNTVVQVVH